MTKYTITPTEPVRDRDAEAPEPEAGARWTDEAKTDEFTVPGKAGAEVTLSVGTAYETDDPEEAAIVADGAMRRGSKPEVVTEYDDEAAPKAASSKASAKADK